MSLLARMMGGKWRHQEGKRGKVRAMSDDWNKRFWLFFLGSLGLRIALAFFLDLTPDEAYYWELSRHLDLSYFDHPPMVAYFIGFFRVFLGDTVAAVRLPTLISFSAVLWAVYQLGRTLGNSDRTGCYAALLTQFTPAGVALGFITTPDSPLSLFWSLGALMFLKALDQDRGKWWIGLGVCLGFGAMSKYNMIFFCPGVAAVILLFAERRKLLGTGRFWTMFFLAFCGALPVLFWNYTHEWISFKFQFNHGFKVSDRTFLGNVGEFLGGQLGTIGPTLYPAMLWVTVTSLISGFKARDERKFSLAALAFPMTAFFCYTGMKSKVEANWPQVAYLTALPLVSLWMTSGIGERRIKWVFYPSVFLALLAIIQAFTLVLPIPPKSDVSTRLHGWTRMGELVRKVDLETGRKALFIGQGAPFAALVSFYGALPPDRIAEVHGVGNWKFWSNHLQIASDTEAVYVDTGRFSEARGFLDRFFPEGIASQGFEIDSRNRIIRNVYFTRGRGYTGNLKFE